MQLPYSHQLLVLFLISLCISSSLGLALETVFSSATRTSRASVLKHGLKIATLSVVVGMGGPSKAAAGDFGVGQKLFSDNCASCHLGGANFVKEERTLEKEALEKYGVGTDQQSIQTFVTNSQRHRNLVFFRVEGGKLNAQQWEDVTEFVSEQATQGKW